ncbi:hypothetical protein HYPSUDRAFT_65116 [Hypholoma sublateritium FD-334 SS-4]|uniref:Uncharacterized protein n=1 Tax=Hypholoma sublateritium (strain FD-334 SS-4) TaxID=945553 RepID=A0A0D2MML3_HYPSF|nr:hypothetical protein HYPSUDRAFT_65116 [Hypholoma sublateritium FD-334 SS-4]
MDMPFFKRCSPIAGLPKIRTSVETRDTWLRRRTADALIVKEVYFVSRHTSTPTFATMLNFLASRSEF